VLERRPDIARSEQELVAANARIGAARALYFPSISLTGAFGYASPELSDLFKGPSRTWSYGGSVTGPIFTAGAISGQVRQAEAARKAALLSYESSIQSAFAEVEDALVFARKDRRPGQGPGAACLPRRGNTRGSRRCSTTAATLPT
jgi:multidrug efflux system outer membrane protein